VLAGVTVEAMSRCSKRGKVELHNCRIWDVGVVVVSGYTSRVSKVR